MLEVGIGVLIAKRVAVAAVCAGADDVAGSPPAYKVDEACQQARTGDHNIEGVTPDLLV